MSVLGRFDFQKSCFFLDNSGLYREPARAVGGGPTRCVLLSYTDTSTTGTRLKGASYCLFYTAHTDH